MKEEIKKLIENAILSLKKDEADFVMPSIVVENPKVETFGDFTTNVAMNLARTFKKSPMEIAKSVVDVLNVQDVEGVGNVIAVKDVFEKIEVVAPGYINFYLSEKYLQDKVKKIIEEKEKFGNLESKEKTMVEYSQPNTHKEFHVGHLRNVIIGSSLVEVLKKAGQNVTAANYIGDTGTHVAKCLWSLQKFYSEKELEEAENKAEFLGQAYSRATQEIENNPEYEKEFKELQKKFEEGDANLTALWKKTRQWSLDEFTRIYEKLGAKFDVYFYESEEEVEGKKKLPELLKTGIIRESEGAIIADLEKWNLGVLVLRRSDGAALYGLKDIPLAIKKFKEYEIDRSIYIVDVRQSLYFDQLFKILSEIGFKKEMAHIGYDFVTLKGGEGMSSRKGNIIPADSLLGQVEEKVREKFPESPSPEGIALGAVKFFMLKYSSHSKIEFDIEESVRLDGSTGPYVQYAHARICSILRKAKEADFDIEKADLSKLTHSKELSMIRELEKFPALIEEISASYEVHKLPYYAIRLADKFHSFYNDIKVLDATEPAQSATRLKLINAVRIVLAETLRLIGVEAPEKM